MYSFKEEGLKLSKEPGGVRAEWENASAESKAVTFYDMQYAEGLKNITFKIDIISAVNTKVKIRFQNRFKDWFEYVLPDYLMKGRHDANIGLDRFAGEYTGNFTRGDEIYYFEFDFSGADAKLDVKITDFVIHTPNYSKKLFDMSVFNSAFADSSLYPQTVTPFVGDRIPRVFIADNPAGVRRHFDEYIEMAKEWPGAFGIDFAGGYEMYPANKVLTRTLNDAGIKTTFESHKTAPHYCPYMIANDLFFTKSDGSHASGSFLYPGQIEDITQQDVKTALETRVEEAAKEGFSEFLIIDYIWPWDGRWGYGGATVRKFVDSLKGNDSGMYIGDGNGGFRHARFWDYLRIYTDVGITPCDVANFNARDGSSKALTSWDAYWPVTEAQASIGDDKVKRNYFLFNALWHYEQLKYLQSLGDYAKSKGIMLYTTQNPEDTLNGTDMYLMGMLRNVGKGGYEYFGNPIVNTAWYHTMRYYCTNLRKYGHDMTLIGEINSGGHGPTRYAWDAAYAHYYDCVSASKPIDYNNQYMEDSWRGIDSSNPQWGRYAHWYSGALAFLQTYEENTELQPAKSVVLVASRSVLEYQPGSIDCMNQVGNMAALLDMLHIPFDSAGKEGFCEYAAKAKVLVYCPAESSPMHEASLNQWLGEGNGKTLVTHSFVPFSRSAAIIDLIPRDRDIVWDGIGDWSTALNSPRIVDNGISGLALDSVSKGTSVSIKDSGITLTTDTDIYRLGNAGAKTLVSSDEGHPLVSEVQAGSNRILYINANITDKKTENAAFNKALALKAMAIAGVEPEASAPSQTAVHIYKSSGGKSVVLWDTDVLKDQGKVNFHKRIDITPVTVFIPADSRNTEYAFYDFFNNAESVVNSGAEGVISYTARKSTEIFYFGKAGDTAFKAVLDSAKKTRGKLEQSVITKE